MKIASIDPYGRNWKRGVQLNNRTLEMLEITELRTLDRFGIVPLSLSQGSYSTSVSQSGGTHDGGGALDVRVVNRLTQSQIDTVVWALRKTGFAAWHRLPSQGDWPEHIHAIAIGDREMSDAAARQVVAYRNGRNGLANNGPDDGPRVDYDVYRQDIDLSYYGPERWDDADFVRFERKVGWLRNVSNLNTPEADTIDASTSLAYTHKNATDAEIAAKAASSKADTIIAKVDEVLGKLPPPPVPV